MNRTTKTITVVAATAVVGTIAGTIAVVSADFTPSEDRPLVFYDVSALAGIESTPDEKYGGPTVADFDNDGFYDLIFYNHNQTPIFHYRNDGDGTFTEQPQVFRLADTHGVAPGDYDRDGDLDALVSLGGGSGTKPQPPRLLRNDGDGVFTDVTVEAGLSEKGARGRTVKWIDLDVDGLLDCLTVNAPQTVRPDWPRNIFYRNLGDGTFEYVDDQIFQEIEAEKVFVTDFDQDGTPDMLTFGLWEPLGFYRGKRELTFEHMNKSVLPESLHDLRSVFAIAEADIDNDGDMDYYLARGGNRNSYVNVHCNQMDVRFSVYDQLERSLTFTGGRHLKLTDFGLSDRGKLPTGMPIFLGAEMKRMVTPGRNIKWARAEEAEGFPEEMTEEGWYLGWLDDGQWKLAYHLDEKDRAWHVWGTIADVRSFEADFDANTADLPDVLLRNDGGTFTDISDMLPDQSQRDNRGVTPGDFNNDGLMDFMVFRASMPSRRIPDFFLINRGDSFEIAENHGATDINTEAHGDMGIAFDYDLDGDLDIFSGDQDGPWRLYANQHSDSQTSGDRDYVLLRIGNSPDGVDPMGAIVQITSASGTQTRVVGSGAAAFSQCLLNIVHFGLGTDTAIDGVTVTWRDGTTTTVDKVEPGALTIIGNVGK
ncbi:MAG: CRTAC1 family protein [Planctomycetota bacterium]